MTRTRHASLLLVASLLAAACSGGGEETAPTTEAPTTTTTVAATTTTSSTTTTSTTTSTTTTVPEVVLRMPLTGVVLDDESQIPARPALAVKIDNHPRSRPQAGLNEADVVFEENVEGTTRFAAVFHSADVDPLGPIRSGRSQDLGILLAFDRPLFAWSGGNAGVRALIRGSDLVDLDAGRTPGYYRRTGRGGAPHNLYSSTQALWANTPEDWSVPPQVFDYLEPGEVADGAPATVVRVAMDGVRVRWDYDAELGLYVRSQNDAAHETETSGRVSTNNVVVMEVDYLPSSVDRNSPEAQLVGEGPVTIFSAGTVRVGTWRRASVTDPYRYEFDGLPIGLVPGRTWVELARTSDQAVVWE